MHVYTVNSISTRFLEGKLAISPKLFIVEKKQLYHSIRQLIFNQKHSQKSVQVMYKNVVEIFFMSCESTGLAYCFRHTFWNLYKMCYILGKSKHLPTF